VGFSAGWNIANVGAVASGIAGAYGVGLAAVALFTTALFLTHMLMQLPAGRLSDRIGAARVCAAGLLALAVCNAAALVAAEPALGLAARATMGIGTALAFIGGSDYVRATGGSPFAQGLYGGLATAGGGVALAVVPLAEGLLGWRAPWVTAIGVAALAGLVLALSPRVAAPQRASTARPAIGTLVADARMRRLAVLFAGSFGLSVVIGNWVVTLLEDTTALEASAAGAIGGATLVLGVVSRPVGGWILRSHPTRVRGAIAVSALVGTLGTLALTTGSVPLAIVGAVAVGLAAGIPFAAAFTGAAGLYPDAPATAVGLINATGALTVLLGAAVTGLAFQHDVGVEAFVLLAGLWAASAVALVRRSETAASVG